MPDYQALVQAAIAARQFAYAPYSHYQVGAAVLGLNGQVWTGCNIENGSYGATICAERVAVSKMVSEGILAISCVAVATSNRGTPCGICLQVMREFAPSPINVLLASPDGSFEETTLDALMPRPFLI